MKSQKKLLINNALSFALAIEGLALVAFGGGAADKLTGAFLVFASLGFIK